MEKAAVEKAAVEKAAVAGVVFDAPSTRWAAILDGMCSEEKAVVEEAVVVDEVHAVVVSPETRWAALLDGTRQEDMVFDYGGCVLAY